MFKAFKKKSNADEGGESSGGCNVQPRDLDVELARQLQEQGDVNTVALSSGPSKGDFKIPVPLSKARCHDDGYPKDIQDDLVELQEFARDVRDTTCWKCDAELTANFTVSEWLTRWRAAQRRKEVVSFCAARCGARSCGAMTCLGCAQEPRIGRFIVKFDDETLDYCCSNGRLFAVWVLLSKYDSIESRIQAKGTEQASRSADPTSKGTGHTKPFQLQLTNYDDFFRGYTQTQSYSQTPNFKQADDKTDDITRKIIGLVTKLLPSKDKIAKPALCAMIELSLMYDRAAQLLHNDSLQDATKREGLYHALLDFVHSLGSHPDTEFLVREKRYVKKRSPGLANLSAVGYSSKGKGKSAEGQLLEFQEDGLSSPLISCMEKLSMQSKMLLQGSQAAKREFNSASGRATLTLAERISSIYDTFAPRTERKRSEGRKPDKASTWAEYQKNNAVSREDRIINQLSGSLRTSALRLSHSPKDRMKWLVTEIAEMSTSLPPNIFVKVDDVRPDVLKCLIIGSDGTPYEGGLFE